MIDMTSRPLLNLSNDERKRWKKIQEFAFSHATPGRQVTNFFWRQSVEAFDQGAFLCSSILASITAELAHKTSLKEQGVEMKEKDGRPKMWGRLIQCDEKDEDIKKIAIEIKDRYRNVWAHPDYEEIKVYLKRRGASVWSDAAMNIAFASADLKPLELTRDLLARLFGQAST